MSQLLAELVKKEKVLTNDSLHQLQPVSDGNRRVLSKVKVNFTLQINVKHWKYYLKNSIQVR